MRIEMYRPYSRTHFASNGYDPREQRGRVGGLAPVKPSVSRDGLSSQHLNRIDQECVSRDAPIGGCRK